MMNLIRFRSPEAQLRFMEEMSTQVRPMLDEVGAEIVYSGDAGPEFNIDEQWDRLILVRYPSYERFYSLVTNETWVEVGGTIRDAHIADSRLLLTTPTS